MIRQASTIDKTLPWWLGGEGLKTTENKKNIGPVKWRLLLDLEIPT
jgi:hypothetical protein